MLPTFIGIGAPKAGTTWLAKCLGEHPEVFMAAVKEVDFFKYPDFGDRVPLYASHFVGAEGYKAVGEFTVRYFALPDAPQRIRQLLPNARLLLCLRNPVDQVVSHYWHLHRQNFHTLDHRSAPNSIEEAIERFPEALLSPARYSFHLERWFKEFPREQMLVLLYDDINQFPEKVLQQTYGFLGVAPSFNPAAIRDKGLSVRQGTSPRNAFLARLHRTCYSFLTRGAYGPLKQLIGTRRAARLKDSLRIRETMNLVFMRKGYPPPAPQTRQHLRSLFAEDISRLETMLQLDLSRWK